RAEPRSHDAPRIRACYACFRIDPVATLLTLLDGERSSMPPLARHHKIAYRLACPGSYLALAELFGQGIGIARVADSKCRDRFPALRDTQDLSGFLVVETGHLVDEQSLRGGFDGEQSSGCAGVVESVAIGSAVVEVQPGDSNAENCRVAGPAGVELDEHAEQLVEVFLVAARSYDKSPRLLVIAGRRPASGLEQAAQYLRRKRFITERARTPALANELVNRCFAWCGLLHEKLSILIADAHWMTEAGWTMQTRRSGIAALAAAEQAL